MDADEKTDCIYERTYWKVLLNPDQSFLGRCLVILKRPCGDLGEITDGEIVEFLSIVKALEASVRKAFGATMFNWTCLMNFAYQNSPPNPQVHWHLRPRYQKPVQFESEVFTDEQFGHHYQIGTRRAVNPETKKKIILKIQKNL